MKFVYCSTLKYDLSYLRLKSVGDDAHRVSNELINKELMEITLAKRVEDDCGVNILGTDEGTINHQFYRCR